MTPLIQRAGTVFLLVAANLWPLPSTASSGTTVNGKDSSSITVSLTVMNPCMDSRHIGSVHCDALSLQRTTESLELVRIRDKEGTAVPDSPAEKFLIRTID